MFSYNWRPGQRSQCSDWLRAGHSGVRTPVGAKFFVPVQTGPETHPASCGGYQVFTGVRWLGVVLTTHPFVAPRLRVGWNCTSASNLCLHRMSWGDLYLLLTSK